MLTKLENINKKSFNNFTLTSDLSKVNVFFGINGAGKTAVSEYIQYCRKNVIVFDSKFVQDNILLENQEEIQGVALTTGEKEKRDKEKIRQIAKQIKLEYEKLHGIRMQKSNDSKQLYLVLNETLKKAKQQFQTNKIKQKPHAKENPVQACKLWQKDILSDNYSHGIALSSSEEIQEKIENLKNKQREVLKINFIYTNKDAKKLSSLLTASVIKPQEYKNTNFYELLKWLEAGLSIHQLDKSTSSTFKCLFCESVVSTKDVKSRIDELIHNNYSNFESFINNVKNRLSLDKEMVLDIPQHLIDSDIKDKTVEAISDLEKIIDSKLKCPNKTINTVKITDLNNLITTIMQVISKQQSQIASDIDRYQSYRLQIEQIAKSWIGRSLEDRKRHV